MNQFGFGMNGLGSAVNKFRPMLTQLRVQGSHLGSTLNWLGSLLKRNAGLVNLLGFDLCRRGLAFNMPGLLPGSLRLPMNEFHKIQNASRNPLST